MNFFSTKFVCRIFKETPIREYLRRLLTNDTSWIKSDLFHCGPLKETTQYSNLYLSPSNPSFSNACAVLLYYTAIKRQKKMEGSQTEAAHQLTVPATHPSNLEPINSRGNRNSARDTIIANPNAPLSDIRSPPVIPGAVVASLAHFNNLYWQQRSKYFFGLLPCRSSHTSKNL